MSTEGNTASEAVSLTIQGLVFPLPRPLPYAEGHVLNANEATALNQTWLENIRNNQAGAVKKAMEGLPEGQALPEEKMAELLAKFNDYANTYTFAQRSIRTPLDPVGTEARKIAKAQLTAALRAQNIDLKTLPEGKMDELISGILAKYPEVTEEARRRIHAQQNVSASILQGLGIGGQVPAAEPAAEPQPKGKKHKEAA